MGSWSLLVLVGAWMAVAVGLLVPAWRDYRRDGIADAGRRDDR